VFIQHFPDAPECANRVAWIFCRDISHSFYTDIARIDCHETASSAPPVQGMTMLQNRQPRGKRAKLRDQPQYAGEQIPRNGNLGHLKAGIVAVTLGLRAGLDCAGVPARSCSGGEIGVAGVELGQMGIDRPRLRCSMTSATAGRPKA
jgi:hypothetical protein